MQATLQQIAAALGYGGSEIFPKQVKLHLERDDVGNFLNLPYYNAEEVCVMPSRLWHQRDIGRVF